MNIFKFINPVSVAESLMFYGGGGGKGGGGGGGGGGSQQQMRVGPERDYAAEQAATTARRQGQVENQFAGFDDNFYNGRQQAFIDNSKPAFDRQRKVANDQLVASLATRGQLDGSVGATELSDFNRSSDDIWQSILAGANNYSQGLRSNVANQRNSLMGMAGSTDDGVLSKMAGDQVALSMAAPSFSPVGQLFSNYSTPAAMGIASQGGSQLYGGTQNIQGTPQVANRRSGFSNVTTS